MTTKLPTIIMAPMTSEDASGPAPACNIGPAEITRRRRGGYALLLAGLVLAGALLAMGADPLLRLAVALPFGAGTVTWLQAHRRLCVGFAAAGIRNLGELGQHERVDDQQLRADRAAAFLVVRDGALVGLSVALIFAALPI
jgi:hypothetical protein